MTRACKALLIFGSRWTLTAQDGLGTWTPFFAFFEQHAWIQHTRCIAPDEATLKVLPRSLSANRAAKSPACPLRSRVKMLSYRLKTPACIAFPRVLKGADVLALLLDAQSTALSLSAHADNQRLLAHVLSISAGAHKWGETVDDVMKLDRKQLSHLNALYRFSVPMDATNHIYYFCLCLLVRTSPLHHTPLMSWTEKLAKTSSISRVRR